MRRSFVLVLAVLLAGCGRFGFATDREGASDGPAADALGGITPRLVANAYFSAGAGTAGMSMTGFSVPTAGIVDGDFVVFIASVDNGSDTIWPLPAAGFTQLDQHYFGSDGQTMFVASKIASSEPGTYAGTYATAIGSSAATITVLAVTGFNPGAPIDAFARATQALGGTDPAVATSPGVTTTVAGCLLLFAMGADWLGIDGKDIDVLPAGFTLLTQLGDQLDHWTWTSQTVAWRVANAIGPTGPVTGQLAGRSSVGVGTIPGEGWDELIAIAPR